jgi:hypothetical protein
VSEEASQFLEQLRARPQDPELRTRLGTWARSEGHAGSLASLWLDRAARLPAELLALAIDAHALGLVDRQRAIDLERRQAAVPITTIGQTTTVFLAGEQDVDVLDEVLPGLVQRAIGRRSQWAVVEVSNAVQDETLAHTLAGLCGLGVPEALGLGVSGVTNPEFVGRCRALCDDPHRLVFWDSLSELFELAAKDALPK